MYFRVVFALLFSALFLAARDLTLGAGAYLQTQPYKGASAIAVPSPVIFYDNGIFYARWTRVGLYFYGHKADKQLGERYSWGFSLTAQPRPNGYRSKDAKALAMLDDKQNSIEGGISFGLSSKQHYLEAMFLTDLLGRYKAYRAKLELGLEHSFGELTLYPSIVAIYESDEFVNYYYGISNKEASKSSYDPYLPGGGARLASQSYLSYPLTARLYAFCYFRVDALTKGAASSPIVDSGYFYSTLFSLIYTFKHK